MSAEKHESYPYWWFQGESVKKLRDLLAMAGPDARLEAHLTSGFNLYFKVIDSAVSDESGVNDSRICPPICP